MKHIEFVKFLSDDGTILHTECTPQEYEEVKWLGKHGEYDRFQCYTSMFNKYFIHFGHLNDGTVPGISTKVIIEPLHFPLTQFTKVFNIVTQQFELATRQPSYYHRIELIARYVEYDLMLATIGTQKIIYMGKWVSV